MEARVLHLEHAGQQIVVAYDETTQTAHAYVAGAHRFRWTGTGVVDANGLDWDLLRGKPANGIGEPLAQVPATTWLTDRWRGFHPRSTVIGDAAPPESD